VSIMSGKNAASIVTRVVIEMSSAGMSSTGLRRCGSSRSIFKLVPARQGVDDEDDNVADGD
jgi:hypothetical protein